MKYWIETGGFTAWIKFGINARRIVVRADDKLKWMIGWNRRKVDDYVRFYGWTMKRKGE